MIPRAVMIAPLLPGKTGMGLAMRAAAQLEALTQVAEITLVVLPLIETRVSEADFRRSFPDVDLRVVATRGREDTRFAMLSRLTDPGLRLAAFRIFGRPSLAAAVSLPVLRDLQAILAAGQFDLVHVFRSYLAGAAAAVPAGIPMTIDHDEDDSASWRSIARRHRQQGDPRAADWAEAEAEASERHAGDWLHRYAMAFAASAGDAERLSGGRDRPPCHAIANGIGRPREQPRRPVPGQLVFVGSLRYPPNVEGLEWFARQAMPLVPGAKLLVAGADPPDRLRKLSRGERVRFLGFVEDLGKLYSSAAAAIAPMHAGGGTRIKILEAAAHGVPVVTTPAAMAGLRAGAALRAAVAASPSAFAWHCRRLAFDLDAGRREGACARIDVMRQYDLRHIVADWRGRFDSVLKRRSQT
jgi:polysaccharide biosynthesis protein PslH